MHIISLLRADFHNSDLWGYSSSPACSLPNEDVWDLYSSSAAHLPSSLRADAAGSFISQHRQ